MSIGQKLILKQFKEKKYIYIYIQNPVCEQEKFSI